MDKLFKPLQDLISSLYDLLFDAAQKVWSLFQPVALVGLLFDLLTGKLGWIDSILGFYHQFLSHTTGANWWVLLLVALLVFGCCSSCKK